MVRVQSNLESRSAAAALLEKGAEPPVTAVPDLAPTPSEAAVARTPARTPSADPKSLNLAPPRLGAFAFRGSRDLVRELKQRGQLDLKAADVNHDGTVTEHELWNDYATRVQQKDVTVYRAIGTAVEAANPDYAHQMGDADLQPLGRTDRLSGGEFKAGAPDIEEYVKQSVTRYAAAFGRQPAALTDTEKFNATVWAYGSLKIQYDARTDPNAGMDGSVAQPGHTAIEMFANAKLGGVCIDQANLFTRMLRDAGLPAQVVFVRNSDARHQNGGAHAIARVRIDGKDHDIEEQAVLEPAKSSAMTDVSRSPHGALALQRMESATKDMRALTPLSDLGAYACELGNTASERLQQSLDPARSVEERQRFLAHGYEEAQKAVSFDSSQAFLSNHVMTANLSAYVLYKDPKSLLDCCATADSILARTDLTTSDRLTALGRKLEAQIALGVSTADTTRDIIATGSTQGEASFTYGPMITRSRVMRAALGASPARVTIGMDAVSRANLKKIFAPGQGHRTPESLTPAVIRQAEEMP